MIRPPAGYAVGPATRADFDGIVSMVLAADIADWGEPDFMPEFLEHEWSFPQLDLGRDTWLVADARSGEPVAYTWLLHRDEHRELDGWGVVHPAHRGRGIGSFLLDVVEARAAEHAESSPEPGGASLRWGVSAVDDAAHRLLERRGFEEERHMWRMDVHLEPRADGAAEPPCPPGIAIRAFDPQTEAGAVHAVIEASFSEHWASVPRSFEEWSALRMGSKFDPSLWRVAIDESTGEVVGALIGMMTQAGGDIETLGVLSAWRGRGIGLALLRSAFDGFARRGVLDVALDVDSQNATGAVALYERAGMHVTRQFDVYSKRYAAA